MSRPVLGIPDGLSRPQPSKYWPQPSKDWPQPSIDQPQPSKHQPQPSQWWPQPSIEWPQPSKNQPQPTAHLSEGPACLGRRTTFSDIDALVHRCTMLHKETYKRDISIHVR